MCASRLVLDIVLVGTECQGPSLDPGRRHGWYWAAVVKKVLQWLMIGTDGKLATIEVVVKFLDSKDYR